MAENPNLISTATHSNRSRAAQRAAFLIQMMFSFTRVSRNRKTGPIPVVTASKDTCPATCPLRGAGCYAEHGPLALQWERCSLSLDELCKQIRKLPKRQLWRYGQAGDLPTRMDEVEKLAITNGRRPVLCYTHHRDLNMIRYAGELDFHINVSADSLDEADAFARQGLSTVVVLGSEYGRRREEPLQAYRRRLAKLPRATRSGVKVAICPASYHEVTCAECGVCSGRRPNNTIIGFPAHGSGKAAIDRQIMKTRESDHPERQNAALERRSGGPS